MEFLDLPTLAELLYAEDFGTELWGEIVTDLLQQLNERLWRPIPRVSRSRQEQTCLHMYMDKTRTRYQEWCASNALADADHIVLNGHRLLPPQEAVSQVLSQLKHLVSCPRWGFIHGDLNFSNVLYSRRNGHFRLVDPRGRFGDLPAKYGGDLRYEIAKLRHSYHGQFEAFLYDLFVLERHGETSFSLQVPRLAADLVSQLDQVVVSFGFCLEEIQWLEAGLFISMLPLHQGVDERATALFLNALDIITRLTADESAQHPSVTTGLPFRSSYTTFNAGRGLSSGRACDMLRQEEG
jgi:hypothetical protein